MQPEVAGGPSLHLTVVELLRRAAWLYVPGSTHPVSMTDYNEPSWAFAQPPQSHLVAFLVPSLLLARRVHTVKTSLHAMRLKERAVRDNPVGVGQAGCVAKLDQVRHLASCLVLWLPLRDLPKLHLRTEPLGTVSDEERKLLKHHLCYSAVSEGQAELRVRSQRKVLKGQVAEASVARVWTAVPLPCHSWWTLQGLPCSDHQCVRRSPLLLWQARVGVGAHATRQWPA